MLSTTPAKFQVQEDRERGKKETDTERGVVEEPTSCEWRSYEEVQESLGRDRAAAAAALAGAALAASERLKFEFELG